MVSLFQFHQRRSSFINYNAIPGSTAGIPSASESFLGWLPGSERCAPSTLLLTIGVEDAVSGLAILNTS